MGYKPGSVGRKRELTVVYKCSCGSVAFNLGVEGQVMCARCEKEFVDLALVDEGKKVGEETS